MGRRTLRPRPVCGWALLFALPLVWLSACGAPTGSGSGAANSLPGGRTTSPAPCAPSQQWKPPAGNVGLDALAMDAPGDGWAVGALTQGVGATSGPAGAIYHLSDGSWQRLPQTYPGAELSSISMGSPDDGWAASTSGMTASPDRALVLRYSGGQWRQVDIPALDQALKGPPGTLGGAAINWITVRMFGPNAGWMFAWTNSPRIPNDPASRSAVVILRYEAGQWTPIPAPAVKDTTEMFWLSAVSGDEAWLGATDYGASALTTLFAHYVNGAWSIWPQTFPGVTERISMISSTDGWAFDSSSNPGDAGLLRFNGAAWAPVPAPPGWTSAHRYINSDVYTAPDGATWFTGLSSENTVALEQYANGRWSQVAWPYANVELDTLSADGSGDLWGIGDIPHVEGCAPGLVTAVPQGVFVRLSHGRWSRQVLP